MTSTQARKPRLLVVDDTPENIHILIAFLRHTCEVIAATSGAKALESARSSPQPDLILLDVVMPGMSGYQVCEQLKADPQTAAIPIIFVTGMNDEDDEDRGLKLGAADYISKPFRAAMVRARVKHHLELKKHRDSLAHLRSRLGPPLRTLLHTTHELREPDLNPRQCACLEELEKAVAQLHTLVAEGLAPEPPE